MTSHRLAKTGKCRIVREKIEELHRQWKLRWKVRFGKDYTPCKTRRNFHFFFITEIQNLSVFVRPTTTTSKPTTTRLITPSKKMTLEPKITTKKPDPTIIKAPSKNVTTPKIGSVIVRPELTTAFTVGKPSLVTPPKLLTTTGRSPSTKVHTTTGKLSCKDHFFTLLKNSSWNATRVSCY